jgi:hypothetical protein
MWVTPLYIYIYRGTRVNFAAYYILYAGLTFDYIKILHFIVCRILRIFNLKPEKLPESLKLNAAGCRTDYSHRVDANEIRKCIRGGSMFDL